MVTAGLGDLIPIEVLVGLLWTLIAAVWTVLVLSAVCLIVAIAKGVPRRQDSSRHRSPMTGAGKPLRT